MLAMMSPLVGPSLFDDMALSMLTRHRSFAALPRPQLDELDDAYTVSVPAPGIKAQDLEISIAHGMLTVRAGTEKCASKFSVALPRDADIDAKGVSASNLDGLVVVHVPKKPVKEPHRVDVGTSESLPSSSASTYTITLAAPGLAAADLTIEVRDADTLTLSGETAKTGAQVDRSYRLPRDADTLSVRASHVDGLLTIAVPKMDSAPVRRVPIQLATHAADSEGGADSVEAAEEAKMETEEAAPEDAASEEWDELLEDLVEMGFEDRDSNRAALAKHGGSIKLAVKELVTIRGRRV